ncbi:MAG: hypothetical protein L3J54_08810 [Draconibacterium sp.]|nr:hypothetical protein [Draconibacterium sp.]
MNYVEFERALKIFPVFSIKDIRKWYSDFNSRRLVEWQKKSYIVKIRRGYYCFSERERGEHFIFFAANKIYSPSYISLQSALTWYNLIPEGVFITSSVTTKNTAGYDTAIGNFEYKHLRPDLFFGYKLVTNSNFTFKIAEPEKVILDYFYLNPINHIEEIEEIRFNEILINEQINLDKLKQYQNIFNSKILDKRIKMFLKVINA